jgi:putative ABC transport system substrate-binding protein
MEPHKRPHTVSRRLSRRAVVGDLVRLGASAAGIALATGCGVLPGARTPQIRTVRLGVLNVARRADTEREFQALVEQVGAHGWREGHNLIIEERWGNGQRDAVVGFADDLARIPVDVIVAGGAAPVQAARQATSSIPIVIAGMSSDPVSLGLIASLARPGGNITGISGVTPVLSTKRLQLLAQLVPGLTRLAVLVTADNPSKPQNVSELQEAADALGLNVQVFDVVVDDLSRAFEAARTWSAGAILLIGDAVLTTVAPRIAALVDQLRLPAIYNNRYMVDSGGLMSYGVDPAGLWRRAGDFVDRILRDARPADLPVELPTTFEFVVNRRTAESLGIVLPPEMAMQVTEWVH